MATAASSLTNLSADNARFNAEAAAWDSNPFVHTASTHAAKHILSLYPSSTLKDFIVLELGCGTGLLTLQLAPHVKRIVAVDAADGMVKVLQGKLDAAGTEMGNVDAVAALLEDPEDERLPRAEDGGNRRVKFDLIVSHLVLHHIPELKPVLETMKGCLKPGGRLALTDFEDFGPEARRFHPKGKMEGVQRDGIEPRWMEGLMSEVEFEEVKVERAWNMEKKVERWEGEFGEGGKEREVEGKGEVMQFPFVVCKGVRP